MKLSSQSDKRLRDWFHHILRLPGSCCLPDEYLIVPLCIELLLPGCGAGRCCCR